MHAAWVLRLLILVATAAGGPLLAADASLTPAFTLADVDAANSGLWRGGERTPLDQKLFLACFEPATSNSPANNDTVPAGSHLLLTFRKPVALGTALLGSGDAGAGGIVVQTLRAAFKGPPTKAAESDWQSVSDVETFAPDFRTGAVRLVFQREYRGAYRWLAWKERLPNLTPAAVGSGEKAPFGAHPNAIPLGRSWNNTDRDSRPGAPKQVQRAAVSDVLPSWYLLSWDTPQSIAALWLSCNADQFTLYAYRGDPGQNPAIAPKESWRRVPFETLHEQTRGGDALHERLLVFKALKTIALKVEMTACQRGPIARVGRMAALTLSTASASAGAAPKFAGKEIAFAQPFDGQLAVAVTDESGRLVRNLVAQVERSKGPNVETWDLKDEAGMVVPAGKYRWKAIASPPIGVRYQTTVYPNASQFFPEQTPWLTGESGPNGWMADHSAIYSGGTSGDRVYFGSPGVEAGVGLIECDLRGKKLWGKHGFAAFSGVGRLAGDAKSLYIQEQDSLHRLDPKTHAIERIASLTSSTRQGHLVGMAAHEGTLALSHNAPEPWLDNATRADVVDLDNCLPKFAAKIPDPTGTRRVEPIPRVDFLRLLRLTGTPAGQGTPQSNRRETQFPITIDTVGEGKFQYVVIAFKEPVPLGSVVLPSVGPEFLVDLAVQKPGASYPPDPHDDAQWLPAPEKPRSGAWTCVPMPAQSFTRGLRLRVRRAKDAAEENLVDDILAAPTGKPRGLSDFDLDKPAAKPDARKSVSAQAKEDWFASFEGLKLLRRRFEDVTPQAKVRVSSGEINAAGEWDAKRSEPLSVEEPAVYVLDWPEETKLTALAIKEIDGAVTEVDVWDEQAGEAGGQAVPLTDSPGWKHVATYTQARRDGYHPAFERNNWARYLDGYVSLGGVTKTRAVRLRVVSQWADLGDRGVATLRYDRGGFDLDRRRCRIYGVAALGYLGEEAPLDTLSYRRIERRDGATGKLQREFTVQDSSGAAAESPASLAYRSDGALFGIQQQRVVRIDTQTGMARPELPEIDGRAAQAHRLAIGPDGSFYVYVLPQKNIRVYDRSGRRLRTIGKPGGVVPGPWEPEKFCQVEDLVVDAKSQLWVVESQDVPRRIVQYDAAGKFVREFFGNTGYGGGGVLDPLDKTRLFYNHAEFAIDWKTGMSRMKNLLAPWMPSDCVPMRYEGRIYLVRSPLSHQPTQPFASLYLYDSERGLATPVAAFGEAESFDALQTASVLKKLDSGKSPKDYTFIWCDRDGDAKVDAEEVTFEAKAPGAKRLQMGRLNPKLRCWAGNRVYAPTSVLPNGVPVFEVTVFDGQAAGRTGMYELNDGALLSLGALAPEALQSSDGESSENHAVDKQGQPLWRYPTSHSGVSGLYLPPWEPGYVTNEFGIIGHEVATGGDLGEFVVVHANNGLWKIWTADGLLAGQILRHKFDPKSIVDSAYSTGKMGQAFDNMTAGQEHFHGHFVKAADGKYYIVHGFTYIGLWEVLGLDKFQRLNGEITVSPDDLRSVRSGQEELARREAKSHAKVLECLPLKNSEDVPVAAAIDGVKFAIAYDEESLMVRWSVAPSQGLLTNSGDDFHRYFKTGACLDLQLGVDPAAPANRNAPAVGDLRILFTAIDGKPQAVLYQPVAEGANPKDAWETRTDAGGTTRFDRVVRLTQAKLEYKPSAQKERGYTFTAVIPLSELHWQPQPGQMLRCDWGLLSSDDGHTVKRRQYWSNSLATGTTDEAWEARLEPHLWGTLMVAESGQAERMLDRTTDAKPKSSEAAEIVDDILNGVDESKK